METRYDALVLEVIDVRPVAPTEPTPVVRDVVVAVTLGTPSAVAELATARSN